MIVGSLFRQLLTNNQIIGTKIIALDEIPALQSPKKVVAQTPSPSFNVAPFKC